MKDEIIEELWRIKDELASEANYDVHVLCQKLREQQVAVSDRIVDRSTASVEVGAQTKGTTLPDGCAKR